MTNASDTEMTYRFAAFGARGTIHLTNDSVRSETRSYQGWWEQTIPLDNLSPNYGTLTATPQIYVWSWIIVILFAGMGSYGLIWGLAAYPQNLVSVFLLLFGLWLAWYLCRHRKADWIMFPTHHPGHGLNYTRQGPDEASCDAFTSRLVDSINAKRSAKESRISG